MSASEAMLASDQVVLTHEGREHLVSRIAGLRRELEEVEERLRQDHESEAAAEQIRLRAEIEQLEGALHRAVVVDEVEEDPSVVEMGDEVAIELADGTTEVFAIVHPLEAMVDDDRISVESPLAQAVLGHRPGETVTVDAPAGSYAATIVGRRRLS